MTDADAELRGFLRSAGRTAIAFSGGLDSTYILATAMDVGRGEHVAVFVDLPMLSEIQRTAAAGIAEALDAPMVVVRLGWDDLPGILGNDERRCYICKHAVYAAVREVAADLGLDACVCGDNLDDLHEHRPGRAAAAELDILKPLETLGIGRADVVAGIRGRGLDPVKDTCLLTRLPAGTPADLAAMRAVEEHEAAVRRICGIRRVRFRLDGDRALVQTSPAETPLLLGCSEPLRVRFSELGISLRIDTEGYRGLD